MAEFDSSRTYAIKRLTFALCDPRGQPISLHGSVDLALGSWLQKRGVLILDAKSRKRGFEMLLKSKYSIRPAHAWCRVGPDMIHKLPKEKPNVKPKVVRKRART